jgi:hypothetical protein
VSSGLNRVVHSFHYFDGVAPEPEMVMSDAAFLQRGLLEERMGKKETVSLWTDQLVVAPPGDGKLRVTDDIA